MSQLLHNRRPRALGRYSKLSLEPLAPDSPSSALSLHRWAGAEAAVGVELPTA